MTFYFGLWSFKIISLISSQSNQIFDGTKMGILYVKGLFSCLKRDFARNSSQKQQYLHVLTILHQMGCEGQGQN